MGCGSSSPGTVQPDNGFTQHENGNVQRITVQPREPIEPLQVTTISNQVPLFSEKPLAAIPAQEKKSEPNSLNQEKQDAKPKFEAFDIPLEANKDLDNIFKKPLPPRLQRLAPLKTAPTLTAEQLLEKQKRVDENRQKMLEQRTEFVAKSSRRRSDILRAKEFSENEVVTNTEDNIQTKMNTAELKRQKSLQVIQEKQKIREERARKARERAKEIKEASKVADDLTGDIKKYDEKDSDTDSWLNDENPLTVKNENRGDSGQRFSSGYSSRIESASSDINAGSRTNPERIESGKTETTFVRDENIIDEFFDS